MPLFWWYDYNNDYHQTWCHYSARLWHYPTHCGWPCPPTRLGKTLSSPSWCWWWYWWWWWYGCWTVCGTFVILVHLQRDNTDLLLAINFNFVSFWSGLSRCKNVKKLSAQRKSTRADYLLQKNNFANFPWAGFLFLPFFGPFVQTTFGKDFTGKDYMLGLWVLNCLFVQNNPDDRPKPSSLQVQKYNNKKSRNYKSRNKRLRKTNPHHHPQKKLTKSITERSRGSLVATRCVPSLP